MGLGDLAALGGERQVLLGGEVLPREEDDLVLDQGGEDVGHRRLGQGLMQVDSTDLGAGEPGQRCDVQRDA
jgi:hypothetical protein